MGRLQAEQASDLRHAMNHAAKASYIQQKMPRSASSCQASKREMYLTYEETFISNRRVINRYLKPLQLVFSTPLIWPPLAPAPDQRDSLRALFPLPNPLA